MNTPGPLKKFLKAAVLSLLGIVVTLVVRYYHNNRLELGPETTILVAPLTPEGLPDYFGELNRVAREGVTPENNAAVILLELLEDNPERPNQLLVLSEELQHVRSSSSLRFKTITSHVEERANGDSNRQTEIYSLFFDQRDKAISEPWRRGDFPDLEPWLAANDDVISLLVVGSHRPRFFLPMFYDPDGEGGCSRLRDLLREAHRFLLIRSMQELGEGNVETAGETAMAALRWARLLSLSVANEDNMQATANCRSATFVFARVLDSPEAGPFLDAWEVDYRSLPDRPKSSEYVDRVERFNLLHQFIQGAATDKMYWPSVNRELRTTNRDINRFVQVLRCPTYQERELALSALQPLPSSPSSPPTAHDQRRFDGAMRLYEQIHSTHTRMQVRERLLELKFSLAKYNRDHGSWPPELDKLVPVYQVKIPNDPYSETPQWVYRTKESSYELYSPGPNAEDDLANRAQSGTSDDVGMFDR